MRVHTLHRVPNARDYMLIAPALPRFTRTARSERACPAAEMRVNTYRNDDVTIDIRTTSITRLRDNIFVWSFIDLPNRTAA